MNSFHCLRCNHDWTSRTSNLEKPKACPKCKSYYYDRPRKMENAKPYSPIARIEITDDTKRGK
ncbi:MAG: hypothetical protein WC455_17475 [Dehalococcoidia bacterium]|jgi:predicted Zn-ribbon and HTH transcriptional regulator